MRIILALLTSIVLSACAGKQVPQSMGLSMVTQEKNNIVWSGSVVNYKVQIKGGRNETIKVAWFTGDQVLCDWKKPTQSGISECEFEVDESLSSIIVEARNAEGGGSIMGLQLSVLTSEEPQAMSD